MRYFLLFISFFSLSLFGKDFALNKEKRLELTLSTEGLNRLTLKGDRITKLVAQENTLQIEGDSHDGSLFLSPKMPKNSKVYATLFTEKGFVQPLSFHIQEDIAPVTLVLKQRQVRKSPQRMKKRNSLKTDDSSKILDLLKNVIEGRLTYKEEKNFCKDKNLSFKTVQVFQKGKFTVTRIDSLRSDDRGNFDLKLCFPKLIAQTDDNGTLYVVSDL